MLEQYWLANYNARQEPLRETDSSPPQQQSFEAACMTGYLAGSVWKAAALTSSCIWGLGDIYTARQEFTLCRFPHASNSTCAAMQIADLLTQLVTDTDVTMEVSSFAAVALGLTFVGTCHAASVEAMLQVSTHAHCCSLQQHTNPCSPITTANS